MSGFSAQRLSAAADRPSSWALTGDSGLGGATGRFYSAIARKARREGEGCEHRLRSGVPPAGPPSAPGVTVREGAPKNGDPWFGVC